MTRRDSHRHGSIDFLWCRGGPLIGAFMLLSSGDVLAERVYRYENQGQVIYQDRAPSSVEDNGHSVLDRQGMVLQRVLSREERREARQRERGEELARIRDRALLATFTDEGDLLRTRDDRLGMIDHLIQRMDERIRILSDRLAVVDKRVEVQERSAGVGGAHETLYSERDSLQRNIENAWSLIDSKVVERNEIGQKFERDLERYRELKAARG